MAHIQWLFKATLIFRLEFLSCCLFVINLPAHWRAIYNFSSVFSLSLSFYFRVDECNSTVYISFVDLIPWRGPFKNRCFYSKGCKKDEIIARKYWKYRGNRMEVGCCPLEGIGNSFFSYGILNSWGVQRIVKGARVLLYTLIYTTESCAFYLWVNLGYSIYYYSI